MATVTELLSAPGAAVLLVGFSPLNHNVPPLLLTSEAADAEPSSRSSSIMLPLPSDMLAILSKAAGRQCSCHRWNSALLLEC